MASKVKAFMSMANAEELRHFGPDNGFTRDLALSEARAILAVSEPGGRYAAHFDHITGFATDPSDYATGCWGSLATSLAAFLES